MSERHPLWFIKERVRAMSAYDLVQPPCRIKVNQNENPHDLPRRIKQRICEKFLEKSWSRYPPFVPTEVNERLGRHHGVDPSRIIAGNGSNEVLYALFATALGPGDHVVSPVPTFSLYALLTNLFGARFHGVELASPFDPDPVPLAETARRHDAKIVVLCSPNNPTGVQASRTTVEHLLAETTGLVLLDEAYVEFAEGSLLPLVEHHPRLVVTRTFSKALSLAGLRIGCMIGHPDLMVEVNKGKLPYSLDSFSVTALEVALEEPGLFQGPILDLNTQRQRLLEAMTDHPRVHPIESRANFILARYDCTAPAAHEHFLDRGILVRDVSHYPGLADHLRISVGTRDQTDEILAALADLP